MKTSLFCVAVVCLGGAAALGPAAPLSLAPPPREVKERVLTDAAFRAIVREANQFIQEPLAQVRAVPRSVDPSSLHALTRSNALMIALAAQNRMRAGGDDAGKLATLRDTAVKLAAAVGHNPRDPAAVLRLADLLNQYPDLAADPDARPVPVRLKYKFTHDDIIPLFGNGPVKKGHRMEFHLNRLARQATYTKEDAERLELLGYKAALIAELLRDFDDLVPKSKQNQRGDWLKFAAEVEQDGWRLAEAVRGRDPADMKPAVRKLNAGCANCHADFRECN